MKPGYGHVVPVTTWGYLAVTFYALVGVPLMLVFLANVGDLMARGFRLCYGRVCCYICWKRRRANYELNRQRITGLRQSRVAQNAWMMRNSSELLSCFSPARPTLA